MGGYDLYGNYYPRTQDALNAESAQCAEISANCAEREIREMEQSNAYYFDLLEKRIQSLEHRVDMLEKREVNK